MQFKVRVNSGYYPWIQLSEIQIWGTVACKKTIRYSTSPLFTWLHVWLPAKSIFKPKANQYYINFSGSDSVWHNAGLDILIVAENMTKLVYIFMAVTDWTLDWSNDNNNNTVFKKIWYFTTIIFKIFESFLLFIGGMGLRSLV